ncbi:hypothetical protein GGTG_09048 [Gaeumannomyces tritici R3-111a-1]|uniref:Uncharacterized protein n=1 Tax=Gaeumannomyces tritici (strain R3-111a-1) TaxID=644352 RepID=J3P6A7_GAET3|nr:hypothetical protein GGTG_09048 [Gaeumannomyces tritici R3-111a-1]EJT72181.1 hypothetical protein GGTG_09048 [Gaeumannomyces tritici R3-111a-1]
MQVSVRNRWCSGHAVRRDARFEQFNTLLATETTKSTLASSRLKATSSVYAAASSPPLTVLGSSASSPSMTTNGPNRLAPRAPSTLHHPPPQPAPARLSITALGAPPCPPDQHELRHHTCSYLGSGPVAMPAGGSAPPLMICRPSCPRAPSACPCGSRSWARARLTCSLTHGVTPASAGSASIPGSGAPDADVLLCRPAPGIVKWTSRDPTWRAASMRSAPDQS